MRPASATRFYVVGGIGALMLGVAIAGVAWGAYGLGLIGSCSSTGYSDGGPVPTCTSESVTRGILIIPAVLLGLAGLFVAGRRAPRAQRTGVLGFAAWALGYLVVGAALIAAAFDPANDNTGGDRWGWAIPGFIFVPLGVGAILFGVTHRRRARDEALVRRTGIHARAAVTAVEDTNVTINGNPRVRLHLRFPAQGGEVVDVERTMIISRIAVPRPGDTVDLWYDPADPRRFALGGTDSGILSEEEHAAALARAGEAVRVDPAPGPERPPA